MRYNFRDSLGRFAVRPYLIPTTPSLKIVPGRLYGYKGIVVRAGHLYGKSSGNPKWFVCFHKTLCGFVDTKELTLIDKARVSEYLSYATS